MAKKVYIFLAEGFEDVEALTTVDLLRRAGVDIQTVSITDDRTVTTSHGVTLCTDLTFAEMNAQEADMLILPGGMPGTKYLGNCDPLTKLLKDFCAAGGRIAAICAARARFWQTIRSLGRCAWAARRSELDMHGASCPRTA